MEFLGDFILMALAALSLENAIFTRALGISKSVFTVQRTRQIIAYGAIVTVMTTIASMICAPISELDIVRSWASLYRSILYLVIISVVYVAAYQLMKLMPMPSQKMTVK